MYTPPRESPVSRHGECLRNIKYSQGAFILLGILAGGDYDIVSASFSCSCYCDISLIISVRNQGLVGCGTQIAHGLSQYGLGKELLTVATQFQHNDIARNQALAVWRSSVQEYLRTDPLGYLGRRYPSLANIFPADFPDSVVLDQYINPVTSSDVTLTSLSFSLTKSPLRFNLSQLTSICELWFSWRTSYVLLSKFNMFVWPGLILRAVINKLQRDMQSLLVSIYRICVRFSLYLIIYIYTLGG